jgi:HTH-type transcriptional regulator/antitoxin HipB
MSYEIITTAQLAAHMRSLRRAQELTQSALGARVGLSQSRIGKIERRPAQVSVGELLRVLAALDVRVVLQPARTASAAAKTSETAGDW